DVVILDLAIPVTRSTAKSPDDGVRLGELIRKTWPDTKIVVCTTNVWQDAITRCEGFSSVILEKEVTLREDSYAIKVALQAALANQELRLARDKHVHG